MAVKHELAYKIPLFTIVIPKCSSKIAQQLGMFIFDVPHDGISLFGGVRAVRTQMRRLLAALDFDMPQQARFEFVVLVAALAREYFI